jgi:hypothetical protein
MSAKIKLKVDEVRVLDESSELSDSDEPYIIVFVADRSRAQFGFNVPNARTTSYFWGDADKGELLTTLMKDEVPKGMEGFLSGSEYCWGPDGQPAVVDDADDLIILVGMLENDDGSPKAARAMVNSMMAGALANMIGSELSRADMVSRLKKDMDGALQQARMTGIPDFDDRIGGVHELRLTRDDLDKAAAGKTVRKNVTIDGGDAEGAYRIGFDLVPG